MRNLFYTICNVYIPILLYQSSLVKAFIDHYKQKYNLHYNYNHVSRLHALGVKIRIVGKPSKNSDQSWLEDAANVYQKRIRPNGVDIDTIWHKQDSDLIKGVETDQNKGHAIIYLDPTVGKQCSSEKFSDMLYERWFVEGGSRVSFVIGGAEGLPPSLRQEAGSAARGQGGVLRHTLSLSDMTFTHQFARTLLMEQIYRASEIKKGSGKYHCCIFSIFNCFLKIETISLLFRIS